MQLICPITRKPVCKPVVALDGLIYEEDAIIRYTLKYIASPINYECIYHWYDLMKNNHVTTLYKNNRHKPGAFKYKNSKKILNIVNGNTNGFKDLLKYNYFEFEWINRPRFIQLLNNIDFLHIFRHVISNCVDFNEKLNTHDVCELNFTYPQIKILLELDLSRNIIPRIIHRLFLNGDGVRDFIRDYSDSQYLNVLDNKGFTLLHRVMQYDFSYAKLLTCLDVVDVNAKHKYGWTPFLVACFYCRYDEICELLDNPRFSTSGKVTKFYENDGVIRKDRSYKYKNLLRRNTNINKEERIELIEKIKIRNIEKSK